jgi:hypothetical protein
MGVPTDPDRPCGPFCGTKELRVDCIVAHIAQIAEQAGRPLEP